MAALFSETTELMLYMLTKIAAELARRVRIFFCRKVLAS